MNARFSRFLALAVTCAAIAVAVNAKVRIGTLAGVVLDAQGRPVPNATVTVQTSDGLHPHATRTDSAGHFAFERYLPGQYDLRAYSNGAFSNWIKRVYVAAEKTREVTLRLPASGGSH